MGFDEIIQQSTTESNQKSEESQLLSALNEGWQIQEAATYLAHGLNAEGRGYLLTLYNPTRSLTRQWNIASSQSTNALLELEGAAFCHE